MINNISGKPVSKSVVTREMASRPSQECQGVSGKGSFPEDTRLGKEKYRNGSQKIQV